MIGILTFGGESSIDHGMWISGAGVFNAPERDESSVSVPGRNGDLTFWNGRWKNVSVRYPAVITGDFATNAANVRSWLLSQPGYQRLEDTYHPNEFRMGRYASGIEIEPGFLNTSGQLELLFDCWPQRFLKSGETPVEYTTSGETITNPTAFEALPLIVLEGSGDVEVTVSGHILSVTDLPETMTIDSETENAYNEGVNLNNILTLENGFPRLSSGQNSIAWSGNVTKLTITPRWWKL